MGEEIVGLGIVGCGYWGPNLARNFNGLRESRLVALCDRDPKRLEHVGSFYPDAIVTRQLDDLLSDDRIGAVAVATPVSSHYAVVKAALEAGKHVLVEKPMAAGSRECRELIDLARARGLTLMVGHTFLYSPPVAKIREIVDSGEIGEIRYISSRRLNLGLFQKDINVVWDLAPHDLSIICHLMGSLPEFVNCQGSANVTQGIQDVACLSLFFPGGGFAMVHSSWLDPRKVREMTIAGTRKMIVYDDLEPLLKLKIYDQHVEVPAYYDTYAEFAYSYHYGDMYAPRLKQEEPLRAECRHFIECIRTGARPITSGEAGLEIVRILECAGESLRNGGSRVPTGLEARQQ